MSSNQRPDTLMQDRISQVDEKLLQRTAGPYIWVKMRKTRNEQMSAGLPPIADITRRSWHGRKVPIPVVSRCSKNP
jgi:hypothetical protein